MNFRQLFDSIPGVTKNLLIINVLLYLGTLALKQQGFSLNHELGLYYIESPNFMPAQLVTYMFLHGGFAHIFFNMFALLMFGGTLERVWGPKRYLFFYFTTGIGAVLLQMVISYFEFRSELSLLANSDMVWEDIKRASSWALSIQEINLILDGAEKLAEVSPRALDGLVNQLRTPTVGASGAIFGLLLAFGVLFPNTELMLLFFPVPIKAKYFIPGLIIMELYLGMQQSQTDNVAHFAHLGGALFGYILVKIWQKDKRNFY